MIGKRKFILTIIAILTLAILCFLKRIDGVTTATAITTLVSFSFGALTLERFGGRVTPKVDRKTQQNANYDKMECKNGKG